MAGMSTHMCWLQCGERMCNEHCQNIKLCAQSDPKMAGMMQSMQDPAYKSKVEDALKSLKEDPDLKPMLDELETAGPAAMMKWVSCSWAQYYVP